MTQHTRVRIPRTAAYAADTLGALATRRGRQCALVSVVIVLSLGARPLMAQPSTPTYAEVEALLAERDAAIIKLEDRIRLLTQRIDELERASGRPALGDVERETGTGVSRPERAPGEPQAARSEDVTRLEVDEAAAERALERTLVQSGALLLGRGQFELVPTLTQSFAEATLPVSVDAVSGALLSATTKRRTTTLDVTARIGLPGDGQVEIGVPYNSVHDKTSFGAAGTVLAEAGAAARGIGDLRLGYAKTLLRERGARPDIVGRLTYGFGNGDRESGGVVLGSGYELLDASLSFVKRRDPLALFFSLGYTDVRAQNEFDPGNGYSLSLGAALAVSPESSLFGSVSYTSIGEAKVEGLDVPGSDADYSSINVGLSTLLGRGRLLNVFTEIGLTESTPDYSLSFSLPLQW